MVDPDGSDEIGFLFPWEDELHAVFPKLQTAQSEWLAALDDVTALDRKTHELVRLACTVGVRNEPGIQRHAQFARELGATWDEVVATIMLTQPSFGVLPAVQALHIAKQAFDAASLAEKD
ncbi:MAG TPA: carboxymuconolactone decarboxylase family protein [Mycobacteriales bacterium]|nr:carboxymuconolactone decarboxylase family protein [Mycobacteriales bacterium]